MPPANPLPADTAIGRVALRVRDVERMTRFYADVLGLDVREEATARAILTAGGMPLLVLIGDLDAPPRERDETGLFHVAFRVPSRAALGDALERIDDRWQLDGASDHLVSEALYLSDPERNGIEMYCDRPRDDWPLADDGTVEMDTKPLDLELIRRAGRGRRITPDETTVGHVHLEVSSISASEAFYVDTLGMAISQRYGESALFVAAGGYHHHVGLNVWQRRSAPSRGRGLAWYELLLPDAGALANLGNRLDSSSVHVKNDSLDDGYIVEDPDGIEIRLGTTARH
ncbi:MAG: VOC family protein [Natronomonas sp.]